MVIRINLDASFLDMRLIFGVLLFQDGVQDDCQNSNASTFDHKKTHLIFKQESYVQFEYNFFTDIVSLEC